MEEKTKREQRGEAAIEILKLIWSLILMTIALAFGGYVTMKLWNGLVSPVFGLVRLNFWQALGLDLFVTYITFRVGPKDDGWKNNDRAWAAIGSTLMAWGLGAIVMHFI